MALTKTTSLSYASSAITVSRNLGTSSFVLGSTTRIKLDPIGLVTNLLLEVVAEINISVTATTASPMAPYNLLTGVRLTDANGKDRINCPGQLLWAINCLRKRTLEYRDAGVMFSTPSIPTAIGNGIIRFYIDVPVAYGPSDLRGALRADVSGDIYLNLDWDNVLLDNGNADRVYNGQSTSVVTLTSGRVTVWQEYLYSSMQLPDDVNTIHYIEGGLRITDGLMTGSERLINYTINRATTGVAFIFVNNGVMSEADVGQVRLISGPSEIWRYNIDTMYAKQRDLLRGASLPPNFFLIYHSLPLQTMMARQNQIGFTPLNVSGAGNTYLGFAFESFGN